ncbi:hypothetical protein [Pseudochrobactrum sp. MP213Fo]|uniref:hypothetical protein n=1 Tax=Pseudochrobactrum sp. MP213Fo TaxID=3022250 RepID=UPI003BA3AD03
MPKTIRLLHFWFARHSALHAEQRRYAKNWLTRSLTYGLTGTLATGLTVSLVAGALAASVQSAQAPVANTVLIMDQSLAAPPVPEQVIPVPALIQPMPPMPDQRYNAKLHEGAVELNADASFAGIDPFITGPVPK